MTDVLLRTKRTEMGKNNAVGIGVVLVMVVGSWVEVVVVVGVVRMVVAEVAEADDSYEGRKWEMEKMPGHRHKIYRLGKSFCSIRC